MLCNTGNAIIIHGGGLVDCSSLVLMEFAARLNEICDKVFIGRFSFESLYQKEFWEIYNPALISEVRGKRGTYFGTARGIQIEGDRLDESINLLRSEGIKTIVVCGGDGSSRQVSEISKFFEAEGIHIIFPLPLTIDGINGGMSLGITQAVRESIRQIENMVSTSLMTRDNGKFGVVCAELQGRNRDDITANVLKYFIGKRRVADFDLRDLLIIAVPTNINTDEYRLYATINSSKKPTLVLVSEGASISISDIENHICRKVRKVVVGHQSQSNNQTTREDYEFISEWVNMAMYAIIANWGKSICISRDETGYFEAQPIDYYAKLNPREGQKSILPEKLANVLARYTLT